MNCPHSNHFLVNRQWCLVLKSLFLHLLPGEKELGSNSHVHPVPKIRGAGTGGKGLTALDPNVRGANGARVPFSLSCVFEKLHFLFLVEKSIFGKRCRSFPLTNGHETEEK